MVVPTVFILALRKLTLNGSELLQLMVVSLKIFDFGFDVINLGLVIWLKKHFSPGATLVYGCFECWVLYSTVGNIVHDCLIEHNTILGHNSNIFSEIIDPELRDVLPIDENLSPINLIEPVKKPHNSRFSTPSSSYKSNSLASRDGETQPWNHYFLIFGLTILVIRERHISELNLSRVDVRLEWVFVLDDLFISLQDVKHEFDIGPVLSHEAPEGSQEIE